MVHGHHCVEGTGIALDLEENRIGRIRSVRRDSQRLGRADRRADDVQLLATERAVVAVVRVQAAYADPRLFQSVALERRVDQLNRLNHPLLAEQARHIGQGHVGGHP
ncbi:hypothetical protein D3C86_1066270 [compost metagenome]